MREIVDGFKIGNYTKKVAKIEVMKLVDAAGLTDMLEAKTRPVRALRDRDHGRIQYISPGNIDLRLP